MRSSASPGASNSISGGGGGGAVGADGGVGRAVAVGGGGVVAAGSNAASRRLIASSSDPSSSTRPMRSSIAWTRRFVSPVELDSVTICSPIDCTPWSRAASRRSSCSFASPRPTMRASSAARSPRTSSSWAWSAATWAWLCLLGFGRLLLLLLVEQPIVLVRVGVTERYLTTVSRSWLPPFRTRSTCPNPRCRPSGTTWSPISRRRRRRRCIPARTSRRARTTSRRCSRWR